MKLWQLTNCTKESPELPAQVAKSNPLWNSFAEAFESYDQYLKRHDPLIFHELPLDFVQAVAKDLTTTAYLCDDGWLRAWRLYESDKVLRPLEVLEHFGEDVFEDFLDHYATKAHKEGDSKLED